MSCMSELWKYVIREEQVNMPWRIPAKMRSSVIDLQRLSTENKPAELFTKHNIPPLKPNPD